MTRRASRHLATTIARNIRLAREQHGEGLTQRDLARLLNVGEMTVSRWERGSHSPSERHLVALADLVTDGNVAAFYAEPDPVPEPA